MTLFVKLLSRFQQAAPQSDAMLADGIHPPTQMNAVLERERARADRNAGCFSVIVFSVADCDVRRLSQEAKKRVRCIDDVGWIDRNSLGVLLVDCSVETAQQIARDLLKQLPAGETMPACRVEGYPARKLDQSPESKPKRIGPKEELEEPATSFFLHPLPRWKRMLDIFGATIGLTLLMPLFVIVAAIIRRSSPGPIVFKQLRSGWGGRPFQLYKFRSMNVDAESQQQTLRHANEQDGPAFKMADDPRVTPFGKWIRKTSIDELPQLWNVLRGEMTLVGPRPLPCDEQQAAKRWQQRRLDAVPGLTCVWQVRGRSKVSFSQWVRMDIEYIRNISFLNDIGILLATIPAVLLRRGAK
ncbi:MAG: sugar transferase [Planctomycetaceae bacterium]|nr:sugar transferase [Planctomycetaceae bacterium]MBT6486620.1 sugar transferase [Planctomycetaceae bacterium]MBT6496830.1 sugar transferase [Planctomycetaceae bacterium]